MQIMFDFKGDFRNYPICLELIGTGYSSKSYKTNDNKCWKIYDPIKILKLQHIIEFNYIEMEERINSLVNMSFPEWAIKPIRTIYDFRGVIGIEMPYIAGITLHKKSLNSKIPKHILQQVYDIICWCENNAFCPDLDLSNFILDLNDKVWLCDLDSAKFNKFKNIFIPYKTYRNLFHPDPSYIPDDYYLAFKNIIQKLELL